MKLHRIHGKPEWETTQETRHNIWQKTAAATHGAVTPGNILTIIGFGLAGAGLIAIIYENYGLGLCGLVAGRILDVADGWVADKTKTKSPLGELLDATIDKIITGGAIVALTISDLIQVWVLIGLVTPQIVIGILAGIARIRGVRLHPSRAGKLNMAFAWLALVGFVLVEVVPDILASACLIGSYLCVIASLLLGLPALKSYYNRLRNQG